MRILFVAHYFQPEPGFFFGLPFASELVRRGHSVEVITGFPNYPGGRIFPGYRGRLFMREEMDGVSITRMPLYASHDRSALRRTASYLSLATSQTLLAPLVARPADVAYVCQGPATIGLPSIALKWLRRVPFVLNIQDLWPDSLSSAGMFHSERGLRMVDRFCGFVYQQAARIVVIAPGMKERLVERGVSADRVDVVYNWSSEHAVTGDTLSPQLAHELGMQGKFNILYAGNLGTAQALDAVLQAAARVRDELPDVQFVIIGDGVEAERLRQVATREQLHNVVFHPRMPAERIGEVMQLADVLLVHLKRDPLFEITIPAKTQAYLAAGKPILVGVAGDAAELVAQAGAGIACTPEDPVSIAQAAREFRAMTPSALAAMGRSAREFYGQTLSFAVAVDQYEGILSSVCRG